MLPIRTILHPTDFTDQSRPAFHLACSLARDLGAELVVCHVAPPPAAGVINGVMVDAPNDELQAWADLVRVKPDDPRVRVTHRLLTGDPAAEILRLAGEVKAGLVVLGTHGRGALGRLLMGSVAEAVVRNAPCPVVTVKLPPDGVPGVDARTPAA